MKKHSSSKKKKTRMKKHSSSKKKKTRLPYNNPTGWNLNYLKPPPLNEKTKIHWVKTTKKYKTKLQATKKRKDLYKKGYYGKVVPEGKQFSVYRTRGLRALY